jgi:translation initiation factor 1A
LSKKGKEPREETEIPLPSSEEGTTICGVIRHLGGDYMLVRCIDGYERKARIPGKLRKKVWIVEGDLVLVGLWGAGSDKCDVIHKYSRSEVSTLIERGIIPKEFVDALSGLT